MKRYFVHGSAIFVFFLMLFFPKQTFEGACTGLLLWFNQVLPTLLPFIILSNLLLRSHAADLLARLTSPLLGPFFGVSSYGSFAVLTGFLCGYPMGSKVTSDLLRENRISLAEASYLLSFCNNASPAFIVSYLVLQNLKYESYTVPALFILILSPILSSFLFRIYNYRCRRLSAVSKSGGTGTILSDMSFSDGGSGSLLDGCIMDGFETITKVGGYIMLFSILLSITRTFQISNPVFQYILLPSLEITSGISLLCASPLLPAQRFFLCMVCTSFGGLCAAAQTRCMIAGTRLSIRPYIVEKLITAMVTSLLSILYLNFL